MTGRAAPLEILVNGKSGTDFQLMTDEPAYVRLSSADTGGTWFYTLDGSHPDSTGTPYGGPFILTNDAVLRAVAYRGDLTRNLGGPVSLSFRPGLRLSASVGGTVRVEPLKDFYSLGEPVKLLATPQEGYRFERWNDGDVDPLRKILIGRTNSFAALFMYTNTGPIEFHAWMEWRRELPTNALALSERLPMLAALGEDVLVVGEIETPGINAGNFDYRVMRFSSDGDKLWDNTYGGSSAERFPTIAVGKRGIVAVAGVSNSKPSGNRTAPRRTAGLDVWLIALSPDGYQLFDRALAGSTSQNRNSLFESPTGNFILSSSTLVYALPSGETGESWIFEVDDLGRLVSNVLVQKFATDGLWRDRILWPTDGGYLKILSSPKLVKVAPSGEQIWSSKDFPTGDIFVLSDLWTLPSSRIIVIGQLQPRGASPKGVCYGFSPTGELLWDRVLTNSPNVAGTALPNGGLWLLNSSPGFLPFTTDLELHRLSEIGEILEKDKILTEKDRYPHPVDIIRTAGGSLYCLGWNFGPGDRGEARYWLVKLGTRAVPAGTPKISVGGELRLAHVITNLVSVPVTMTTTTVGATIRYTLDGSTDFDAGIGYQGTFMLERSAIIRAETRSPTGDRFQSAPVTVDLAANYRLQTQTRGGGTIQLSPSAPLYRAGTVVSVKAVPNTSWQFIEWKGDLAGAGAQASLTMNSHKSVEGVFGARVRVETSGEGWVVRQPDLDLYPYGTAVRFVAVPDARNFFAIWGFDAAGTSNTFGLSVDRAGLRVGAIFEPLEAGQFAVTAVPNGSGAAEVLPAKKKYVAGEAVTVRAVARADAPFVAWSGATERYVPEFTFTVAGDAVLYAHFADGDPASFPKGKIEITSTSLADGQTLRFEVNGRAGEAYRLQGSSDLFLWDGFRTVTNGTGRVVVDVPMSSAYRFFRLQRRE